MTVKFEVNMSESDPITIENSLEEAAKKRHERLKNLKRKREESHNEKSSNTVEIKLPTPKFRSYKPTDPKLAERSVSNNSIKSKKLPNVDEEVKDLLDLGKKEMVVDQLDLTVLAPRQPDWDLKRDISKKLEKLQKRTQRAMAELIRERLKKGQNLGEIPEKPVDIQ